MMKKSTSQNLPIGTASALYYSHLFPASPKSPYVPTMLVIGFKDIKEEQLTALKDQLRQNYGNAKDERCQVPGLVKRLDYTSPTNQNYEFPFKAEKATSNVLLDIWTDVSNAGYCGYIVGSSTLHAEIENWGESKSRHVTLYLNSTLEDQMYDRSPKWREDVWKSIRCMRPDMNMEEMHQRVVDLDQPEIITTSVLSFDEINYFVSNFLPNYFIKNNNGYPELIEKQ